MGAHPSFRSALTVPLLLLVCKFVHTTVQHAGSEQPNHSASDATMPVASSGDFFVPWHVPFHRADAASAVRLARGEAHGLSSTASGQIDKQKGSVMFKRYYHLFDEGELESLILQVPGVQLVKSFYDKSNWCCIFQNQGVCTSSMDSSLQISW